VAQTYTPATRKPASALACLSLASMLLVAAGSAGAATLSVGPGKTYVAPCAAIMAAKDGDTIEIVGDWTYSGDVCAITHNNLTIRGVQGRPVIDAAGQQHGGKGIWVVIGNNITVENVEMLGAKVRDGNGAALRLEGTNFTLRRAFIHDNENGILANPNKNSDILIEYSEFGHNGGGTGQTHNLYIGQAKSLTFRYSYSHDAVIGHDLKSRATTNMIAYNRFSSTPPGKPGSTASGKPSYEIDLPNGGTSYIIGNVIEQPAINDNSNIVAYAEEGPSNPSQDLYVINNVFLNDFTGGMFLMISNKVTVANSRLVGFPSRVAPAGIPPTASVVPVGEATPRIDMSGCWRLIIGSAPLPGFGTAAAGRATPGRACPPRWCAGRR